MQSIRKSHPTNACGFACCLFVFIIKFVINKIAFVVIFDSPNLSPLVNGSNVHLRRCCAAAAVAGNAAAAEAAAVADVGSGHSANRSSSIIFN